jgi:pimeloyl-ACP methyl ester carboxylesterase
MTTVTKTETPNETDYRSIWSWLRDVSFTQKWIDVDGIRTRVCLAGPEDKPALVLLHGTGGHWEAYAPNLKALSEHFRCICIDMVGNGYTDKPDYAYEVPVYVQHVARTMDVLGIQRASVVGMSLGAWVAARFAHDLPERTEKVILMSPAGLIARAENMARIKRQRGAAIDDPNWNTIKDMFIHLIADEENRIPDIIALRQAIYRMPETRETLDHLLVLQEFEIRKRNLLTEEEWGAIQAPVLVVVSGKDHAEYESTSRRILEYIPNARALEMPHVAHWPNFEDPATFDPAAVSFLLEGQAADAE